MIDPRISMAGMSCLLHKSEQTSSLQFCMFACLVVSCLEFGSNKRSRTMKQEWFVRSSESLGIGAFGVVPGN